MAERVEPRVSTIPPHRSFVDALANGLIARHGDDPMALARGLVLLPNNRSCRALSDAFVRIAGDRGLLLPRMVPIGSLELDEQAGLALDDIGEAADIPAAIDPYERRMLLARLVLRFGDAEGTPIGAAEAIRLAGQLARTLDQLIIEEIPRERLREAVAEDVAHHWQQTLRFLQIVIDYWPEMLAEREQMDAADRQNHMLDRLAERWRNSPPQGFVMAAGIANAAPAASRLLRTISRLPGGEVVLPGLDLAMPEEEWQSLGPVEDEDSRRKGCESHPQFQMKLLLDRMGVARGEVVRWQWGGGRDASAARSRAVETAMAPAEATGKWQRLEPRDRRLSGVRFLEAATPGEEAQAIALALRELLDTPGRTAALVTPDRGLARRVAAHLSRWGITIDDSAGRPLSHTPPGAFLSLLCDAAAERFAPVPLLALLKHPLARSGEERLAWLEDVRRLDKALRGPRPAAGLQGIARHVARMGGAGRRHWLDAREQQRLAEWWPETATVLEPMERVFAAKRVTVAALVDSIIVVGNALGGEPLWAGPAGRAASDLLARLAEHGAGLGDIDPAEFPALLMHLMDEVAVRPAGGSHPRLAIYGLIEARLQRADLMILGSLNEGTWPATPSPDPWLAPRIRAELGLPGSDHRVGLAAHDFVAGLGAPQVLVTRARRDAAKPTVASRLWLRLDAMTGGVTRAPQLPAWAASLDAPEGKPQLAPRPAPCPPAAQRPRRISVTEVDRLKADPYEFYARTMLRLQRQDGVDVDPSPAERGNAIHDILEQWVKQDGGRDPGALIARAEAMLAGWTEHPLMRVLWAPRVIRAAEWAAGELSRNREAGWHPVLVEEAGVVELGSVTLRGRPDRIDRNEAGDLGIIDYKTGMPPSRAQVVAGFALQLGLIGWMAEQGAFASVAGRAVRFEYWRLSGGRKEPGKATDPRMFRGNIDPDIADLSGFSIHQFREAVDAYLIGATPFIAKLHPQYALYSDFDQLARTAEWMGRGDG